MLDNVNDSAHEARELVRLLKQLPAHVNLMLSTICILHEEHVFSQHGFLQTL